MTGYLKTAAWLAVLGLLVIFGSRFAGRIATKAGV